MSIGSLTVRFAAVFAAAALLVSAVPHERGAGALRRRGARGVEHHTFVLVDRGRSTVDPNGLRTNRRRILVTDVYLPRGEGRWPLIVFAHGNAGNPGKLTQLLTAWARAGYVVAAPAFPLTNDLRGEPSVLGDYVNQPADVSFVIDEMLRRSNKRRSRIKDRVSSQHVGLAGHSLGGATALGVTFNSCCRDRRIDALVVMDGRLAPFPDGRRVGRDVFVKVPLLLIHLVGDPVVQFRYAEEIFAAARRPKYLMALQEGVHFEPFEDAPSPHDRAVVAATVAFWDAYLRDEPGARKRIARAGTEPGLSRVTQEVP